MSTPAENLEAALEEANKILLPVADSFVIFARVGNEAGTRDSYRYSTHGPSSERRGLIETFRTYFDEDDRDAWREGKDKK